MLMMERLQYVIEDSTIASLLGEHNFTNKESAVLELVKNSYDAGATALSIRFAKDAIVLTDDGIGMSKDDIKLNWMHVGTSMKKYETIGRDNQPRVLAGSKGIGRFALARLGEHAIVYSHKEASPSVKWETDWNHSELLEDCSQMGIGTRIVISALRDKWTETSIKNLSAYLSKTYNDDKMSVSLFTEDNSILPVTKYFDNIRLGVNCKSIINFEYDSSSHNLITEIKSDEFSPDAEAYCPGINIYSFESVVDISKEYNSDDWDMTDEELLTHLSELGSFTGQLYFNVTSSLTEKEKFLYKYGSISEAIDSGIILYRNAFSISSYEGKKDWLSLGKRSRKSPAAASHPTGAWRVRENQLSGKVEIDKIRNKQLSDLSNRQGLDENVYFDLFVEIITTSIKEFERYRQDIIRAINVKNDTERMEQPTPMLDRVTKSPNTVLNLSKDEAKQLVSELKSYRKENAEFKKGIVDTEQRYKYDVRILNVLATTGLKASSLAHEMRNDRNFIAETNDNIIDALKEYGLWEILCEPEKIEKSYKNVPYLLERGSKINKKLLTFMDTMLQEIEKRQFKPEWQSVADILKKEKNTWEKDYSWLSISLSIDEDICYYISEDILSVIFDNLILNSLQQNKSMNNLNVKIVITLKNDELHVQYSDNGKGLDDKYHNNPRKILEVHETTRTDGHGLGMWIVNNSVEMSGGKVTEIGIEKGFYFEFFLGGTAK